MPNYLGKFLYTVAGYFTSKKHVLVGTFSNFQTEEPTQQTSLNSYLPNHKLLELSKHIIYTIHDRQIFFILIFNEE